MKIPRHMTSCIVAVAVLHFFLASVLNAAEDAQPAVEIRVRRNVMVAMRDGVRMATDLYWAAVDGQDPPPLPVILVRTPYNKEKHLEDGEFFARRGYVFAAQDVRGRFASEGDFYIYTREPEDGFDTVEWLAGQSWCNGQVGTFGTSYKAATQNALATLRPPHLASMFVIVGTSDYIEDGAGRGGALALLHNHVYTYRLASTGKEALADPKVAAALGEVIAHHREWLAAPPAKTLVPLAAAPSYAKWYSDWLTHPPHDSYWRLNGYEFASRHTAFPDVPICLVGGWYDIFSRGTIENYQGLARRKALTRLVMGPWTHTVGATDVGDVDFGPETKFVNREEAARWFDETLLGRDQGFGSGSPVRYFVMAGSEGKKNDIGHLQSTGSWRTATGWPPPESRPTKYFLHRGGSLSSASPSDAAPSWYEYDPHNPVPTLGGGIDSGKDIVPRGAQNQTPLAGYFASRSELPLAARRDVLVFETPPLEDDLVIAGPVHVVLWVASDAQDTDFTAKLVDVHPPTSDYPSGYAMNLLDGIVRMRYRSAGKDELLTPGKVYPITIDLWSTANRFLRGHKIRLDISSSNWPMYDANPNTGEVFDVASQTGPRMVTASNTVYHDAKRPSHVVLPALQAK